jgi:lipopolysaccharide/colanic/teichoic acid biosynthesis glycosyltransferase
MTAIFRRFIDVVLVVSGAFIAVQISTPGAEVGHGFDGSLVAFAAALALSVFPACGIYEFASARSPASLISRTVLAWGIVQACCIGLLYALRRSELLSNLWFVYWTLTSGIGLLLFRATALAIVAGVARTSKRMQAVARDDVNERGRALAKRFSTYAEAKQLVKRIFDIAMSFLLLVALSPVLLTIALVVVRDGGPVLFGHSRVGRNGREFKCLKFRSMVTNADVVLKQLLEVDAQARAEWDREFKLKSDIRITRIGHLLRRTSLDELPQLINVLRGEMSLVGPRPIVEKELPRYGEHLAFYLMTRPGMTGLWQVSGRNNTDYATRVALDVSYVKDWSLRRDLAILFKTFNVVFRGHGAY